MQRSITSRLVWRPLAAFLLGLALAALINACWPNP